jgi:hypothetical protein
LASSSKVLLQEVQLLLLNLGIVSTLHERRPASWGLLPNSERRPRAYPAAAQYELVISRENKDRFAHEVGFIVAAKRAKLEASRKAGKRGSYRETFATRVKTVEPAGTADVYDLTEPQTHSLVANGLVTHNCGEQGLGPWGVCNLGAINLAAFAAQGDVDWEGLRDTVRTAVRFLDDVIDVTEYYFVENERQQRFGIRRTGLGTMGLADLLIQLRIRYGSERAVAFCEQLYRFIRDEAYRASALLAKEKGAFPAFDREKYLQGHFIRRLPEDIRAMIAEHGIRNGVLLTQAPTGTTSLLAGVSSGIEPVYAFSFRRTDRTGTHVVYHELYQRWMEEHPGEPVPDYFVSADQLTPEEHVRMQAVIQKYVDSSISKTVNAPRSHTVSDVETLYTLAYELGCKGVTYFREGSRERWGWRSPPPPRLRADGMPAGRRTGPPRRGGGSAPSSGPRACRDSRTAGRRRWGPSSSRSTRSRAIRWSCSPRSARRAAMWRPSPRPSPASYPWRCAAAWTPRKWPTSWWGSGAAARWDSARGGSGRFPTPSANTCRRSWASCARPLPATRAGPAGPGAAEGERARPVPPPGQRGHCRCPS